ncbi:GNAT family N-acetyltransferase [Crocinitomix catalasitica]|nr:GNAT family N-acetyltransferase [Crocinitomix catalasitica]
MPLIQLHPIPVLQTERLRLRGSEESDIGFIHHVRSSEEVNKFIERESDISLEDTEAFFNKCLKGNNNNESIDWIIERRIDSVSMGTICLWNFTWDDNKSEIGYQLLPEFQEQGIMTEALHKVIKFGFDTLSLDKIEAYTHKENDSSKKLLLKLGFVFNSFKVDEGFPNNVTYSISSMSYSAKE